MRISRTCYDKAHRCPGWAGGGMHYPKSDKHDCHGTIRVHVPLEGIPGEYAHPGSHPWRWGFCSHCDVRTLPVVTKRLDPTYWRTRFQIWKMMRS